MDQSLEDRDRRQNYEAMLGRTVYNLRERFLRTSLETLSPALDMLLGEESPIWPHELVGPMLMSTPKMELGAFGGHAHGKVQYTCVEILDGRRVMFRFDPGDGQKNGRVGVHFLEFEPADGGVFVRHVVNAEMRGDAFTLWVTEGLSKRHDAAVDRLFEQLERFALERS